MEWEIHGHSGQWSGYLPSDCPCCDSCHIHMLVYRLIGTSPMLGEKYFVYQSCLLSRYGFKGKIFVCHRFVTFFLNLLLVVKSILKGRSCSTCTRRLQHKRTSWISDMLLIKFAHISCRKTFTGATARTEWEIGPILDSVLTSWLLVKRDRAGAAPWPDSGRALPLPPTSTWLCPSPSQP